MSASTDTNRATMVWRIGHGRSLTLDRPHVMGILNVTPDSFSDGGRYDTVGAAVDEALSMVADGASVIDIGGESTRPGATRVDIETQCSRVLPVVEGIRRDSDVAISIDTTRALVAKRAIDAGADVVNDVSACMEDPSMASIAASTGSGLVLMHRLRPPDGDHFSDRYVDPPSYGGDVVSEVRAWLDARVDAVTDAGVEHQRIVVDPGLGFGKTVEQNYALIARIENLGQLTEGDLPVLSACSRKSFIGRVSEVPEPADRLAGTLAVSVSHAIRGVRLFRVHDVRAHVEALRVVEAIRNAWPT